jgi:hypothetical protein
MVSSLVTEPINGLIDEADRRIMINLEPYLIQHDVRWKRLSPNDHQDVLARWASLYNSMFGPGVKINSGARALQEVELDYHEHFFLVPYRNSHSLAVSAVSSAYECFAVSIPDLNSCSREIDIFVSPPDLSWTLVYLSGKATGGPYFARPEWIMSQNIV